MPVAKTYAKYPIEGNIFKESGRNYVNVKTAKGLKKVRWYSDAEYKRMYPNEIVERDIMDFDARSAFGFDEEGYITLYKGHNVEEWAENDRRNIRYNLTFLYYTPGGMTLPKLDEGIEPIQLDWKDVAAKGNRMKPHEEVRKYVDKLLLLEDACKSNYQGSEDQWLQKTVTIREKKKDETRFGTAYTYFMADAEDNTYVWKTGTKNYTNNQTISLKMKVKEHKEINGEKCTVVWYCKEV